MRDIQNDLQERAALIDEQMAAAKAQFDKAVAQLQTERDAKVGELKSLSAMVAKFMDFERRLSGSGSAPVPSSPLVTLADLFMGKIDQEGSMSREQLVDLAVKEGFFPDAGSAVQAIHPMLVNLTRSELIRELPNGNFAPPTLSQTIKLRRVV
jgi:multidrug efflux pump subunit AcrA (membrane-fusion protein)